MHDTWAARDLPVLDATVSLLEQSYMVTVTDIAARTGFDAAVVAKALEALDTVYVDFRKTTTGGDPRFWYVFKATPEARRAVGQWPTAQALAGRLAEELTAAAAEEPDPEQQSLLTYAARLVGDTLRDATVRAAARVLAPAFDGTPQPELGMPVPEPEPRPVDDFPSLVPLPELPELLRRESPAAQPPAPEPASAAPFAATLADTAPTDATPADVAADEATESRESRPAESAAQSDGDPDTARLDLVQSGRDAATAV